MSSPLTCQPSQRPGTLENTPEMVYSETNIPTDSLGVSKCLNFTQEVAVADNSHLRSKTLYPQGHWIPTAEKQKI